VALAPYYRRSALAAAQVLDGFDEERFADALATPIGISFAADAATTPNGRALLDLTLRLVARLYPAIELRSSTDAGEQRSELETLARAINPEIEFAKAQVGIVVGRGDPFAESVYVGSEGWDALVSIREPQPIVESSNVLGAGAAACLGAANLFRRLIMPPKSQRLDTSIRYSTFDLDRIETSGGGPNLQAVDLQSAALVGIGAIGNATIWALGRTTVSGELHLIDPECVELSNLQRYVLTTIADVDRAKVEIGTEALTGALTAVPHPVPFAEFVARNGSAWERIAVAVDNRVDRIAVQASLPKVAFNAWTQPGDLGVSIHPHFGFSGACINCLYAPNTPRLNDDELIAQVLGIPERAREVRNLLVTGAPPPPELLNAIAEGLNVAPEAVHAYASKPIRLLYSEGVCGGAVVSLSALGRPAQDVHVPLAHQSALAGVLLAARLIRHAAGLGPDQTCVSRLNILQEVGVALTQPMEPVERCLCTDPDFVRAYDKKWGTTRKSSAK
jgi:hypothetical protein